MFFLWTWAQDEKLLAQNYLCWFFVVVAVYSQTVGVRVRVGWFRLFLFLNHICARCRILTFWGRLWCLTFGCLLLQNYVWCLPRCHLSQIYLVLILRHWWFLDQWCSVLLLFLVVVRFHCCVQFHFAVVLLPLVWLDCVDNPQYLFLKAIQKGVICCLGLVAFLLVLVDQLCQLCLNLLVSLPKYSCGAVFLCIMTWKTSSS